MLRFYKFVSKCFLALKRRYFSPENKQTCNDNDYSAGSNCSVCVTGKRTYELDSKSVCPYISSFVDGKCAYFEKIKKDKN